MNSRQNELQTKGAAAVAPLVGGLRANIAASRVRPLLAELVRLKAVPRTGWLLRGVRDVESVADHSYGVAMLAMLLADCAQALGESVNTERVLRMALLHDVTEARTGDLPVTIKRYFPAGALAQADAAIVDELFAPLPAAVAERYRACWDEYEARASLAARLVKAADKLDLLLQAEAYEQSGAQTLAEFWERAEQEFAQLGVTHIVATLLAPAAN